MQAKTSPVHNTAKLMMRVFAFLSTPDTIILLSLGMALTTRKASPETNRQKPRPKGASKNSMKMMRLSFCRDLIPRDAKRQNIQKAKELSVVSATKEGSVVPFVLELRISPKTIRIHNATDRPYDTAII